jgi:hypothetical protein
MKTKFKNQNTIHNLVLKSRMEDGNTIAIYNLTYPSDPERIIGYSILKTESNKCERYKNALRFISSHYNITSAIKKYNQILLPETLDLQTAAGSKKS